MLDTDRKVGVDILCQFQLFRASPLKLLWQIMQQLFSKHCDCQGGVRPSGGTRQYYYFPLPSKNAD